MGDGLVKVFDLAHHLERTLTGLSKGFHSRFTAFGLRVTHDSTTALAFVDSSRAFSSQLHPLWVVVRGSVLIIMELLVRCSSTTVMDRSCNVICWLLISPSNSVICLALIAAPLSWAFRVNAPARSVRPQVKSFLGWVETCFPGQCSGIDVMFAVHVTWAFSDIFLFPTFSDYCNKLQP